MIDYDKFLVEMLELEITNRKTRLEEDKIILHKLEQMYNEKIIEVIREDGSIDNIKDSG